MSAVFAVPLRGEVYPSLRTYKAPRYQAITACEPLSLDPSTSVRKADIRRLNDLSHILYQRGDLPRARRAWAILVRCREWDGLALRGVGRVLTANGKWDSGRGPLIVEKGGSKVDALIERVVNGLAMGNRELELLEEVQLYLPSHPFVVSAELHLYAGMLSLYLAKPVPRQPGQHHVTASQSSTQQKGRTSPDSETDSDSTVSERVTPAERRLPNVSLLLGARNYFTRALELATRARASKSDDGRSVDEAEAEEDPFDPLKGIRDAARTYLTWMDDQSASSDADGSP